MERAKGFILNRLPFIRQKLDTHMQEVIGGASLALALRITGAGLAFIFNVVIARILGAEGTGLYFLALSITTISSVIGSVGLNNALLRFVAIHATYGEWNKVKGVHVLSMRMAVAASGLLSVIGFIIAPWISNSLLNKQLLAEPLRWMSLSILPFTLLNLHAQSLKGLKRIHDAMLIQGIGVPLVSLALLWPLASAAGLQGVVWAYLSATIVVGLLGYWAWSKVIALHDVSSAYFSFKKLWASCKPLFAVSLTGEALLPFAPILLLGIWASSDDVGIYGAASRVAMLSSFMLVIINNVLAPKFAELYAKGDILALRNTTQRSSLLMFMFSSPLFIVMIFEGQWMMKVFGSGFEKGGLILAILAVGQMVNLTLGAFGYLLVISGNETTLFKVALISTGVLFLFSFFLIPVWGGEGAAVSATVSLIVRNLMLVKNAHRKIGIALW